MLLVPEGSGAGNLRGGEVYRMAAPSLGCLADCFLVEGNWVGQAALALLNAC